MIRSDHRRAASVRVHSSNIALNRIIAGAWLRANNSPSANQHRAVRRGALGTRGRGRVQLPSAKDQGSARSLFRSSMLCLLTALINYFTKCGQNYLRKTTTVSR